MNKYLVLQSTYEHFECAVMQEARFLATAREEKHSSSKNFTFMLERVLNDSSTRLSDLSYMVVNRGPAPFTSLRVVLAAAKGIHAATSIPLVGVDGLAAFLESHACPTVTVALLNAFGNDVYFGIQNKDQREMGCGPLTSVIDQLRKGFPHQPIHFIGNSAAKHRPELELLWEGLASFPDPIPDYPSLESIARSGNNIWQSGIHTLSELLPLYLKNTL